MTFSDWINNIRWKYFTNEKAGLIFKELMKEFEMGVAMTENKRYTSDIHRIYDDNEEIACADTMDDAEVIVDLLNEQDTEIQRLKKELKNRKKMNNILEGFLLDKGYDFNDILKFLQDRTENGEGE